MKRISVVLLALLIFSSLVYAGGAEEKSAAKEEKIALRYMMWDPQIIEKEEALAEKFNQENPNITISIEGVAFGQFWEKMKAMAAAKNMPDVFWMSSGTVKEYGKQGALLNLDEHISKLDASKYYTKALNVLRVPNFQGKLYAFPWAVVGCISFYNIRLFDEAGLAYPANSWTFDDMRSLAQKLSKDTDGDGNFDQWGYWVKARYTHMYPYLYNNGTQLVDDAFTKLQMAEPAGREAFKFLTDLVAKDKFSPTPAQTKGVSTFFTTGKVGMVTEGTWRIDTYRKGLEDPFGIVMVPKGPRSGGKDVVYGWADAYSISAYTKHPDAAWDWMIYMVGPARPVDSILGGKVPILKEAAQSPTWLEKDMLPANKGLVLDAIDLIGPAVTLPPASSEINKAVNTGFEKLVLTDADFDTVMKEMEEEVAKILARQ
jgi:multiple sugar transport system substrate-binding protein